MRTQTILALLAAVGAVVVPIVLYFAGQQSRELSFDVISRAPLLDATERNKIEGLEVLYRGEPIVSLTSISIKVENSGSEPIRSEDFERPIEISFDRRAKIVSVVPSELFPKNLRPEIVTGTHSISIRPILLNPGDRIVVSTYLTGEPGDPVIDMRVAAVPTPRTSASATHKDRRRAIKWAVVGAISLFNYFFAAGLMAARPFNFRGRTIVPQVEAVVIVLLMGLPAAVFMVEVSRFLDLSGIQLAVALTVTILLFCLPAYRFGRWRFLRTSAKADPPESPAA